jgi:hypothetical protein
MAVYAQDIIYKSMRLLGLLASGEAPTAAEAQDSLYSLNSVIDSQQANPQYYFCTLAEQFTTVNAQNTYTIGNDPDTSPAADWVTNRPIRIVGAFVRIANVDTPLGLITEQYWTNISNKAVAGTPTKLLYRPNIPYGQVLLYPTPNAAIAIFIKAEKTIARYATLTTTQYLPPGYQRLLELSLAMELAPEYGSKVAPETVANLRNDLDSLIRTNIQKLPNSKIANIPASNIYTDVGSLPQSALIGGPTGIGG